MAKLTDRQRKKIIAEYVDGGTSQRKLAEKYGVSPYLIRSILRDDKKLTQKIARKKEENTKSILAFMDSQKNDVCELLKKLLNAINDPAKIAATSLSQLATTFGIIVDKFTVNETPQTAGGAENNLFEAINSCGEEGFNDLPEIQQTTEDDAAVVEDDEVSG